MNYELAKQLKNAGFPQNCNIKHYHATNGIAFGIPHPE